MSARRMLKNFCIEPTQRDCSCLRDIRCGGIITPDEVCPEHSLRPGAVPALMKTHFHPVQGDFVGTPVPERYDDAAQAS